MNIQKLFKQKKQIIAEIAQSHDGSLNYVHSFIDQAAKSGADVVKFQAHFADESSLQDKFRTFTSYKKEIDLIIGKECNLPLRNGFK